MRFAIRNQTGIDSVCATKLVAVKYSIHIPGSCLAYTYLMTKIIIAVPVNSPNSCVNLVPSRATNGLLANPVRSLSMNDGDSVCRAIMRAPDVPKNDSAMKKNIPKPNRMPILP